MDKISKIQIPGGTTYQFGDSDTATSLEKYRGTDGLLKRLENVDLNTIAESGRYYVNVSCTNRPTDNYVAGYMDGYMDVYVYDSNNIKQIYHRVNASSVFERWKRSSGWTNWSETSSRFGRWLQTKTLEVNDTITGLSDYTMFICGLSSSVNISGCAVGYRTSSTSIRFIYNFVGNGNTCYPGMFRVTISGDTITNIERFGNDSTMTMNNIYGLF